MEIIAKITHQYGRRARRPGDKYSATTAHAKFLVAQGLSEYPKPPKAATVESKDMAAESAKATAESDSKRAYKRKDMAAEGKL